MNPVTPPWPGLGVSTLPRIQERTKYKGEWDEVTIPAAANKRTNEPQPSTQIFLTMSDTFDPTRHQSRSSLPLDTVAHSGADERYRRLPH